MIVLRSGAVYLVSRKNPAEFPGIYVNTQEIELNNIEKQKQDYKNNYFLKDNKDNTTNTINNKYAT